MTSPWFSPQESRWGSNDSTLLMAPIEGGSDATQLIAKFDPPPSLRDLAVQHSLRLADERPSLGAYLRRLWRYRHFIASYANAKVDVNFGTSKLGRLWQVLTPMTNAAVYYVIFGVILGTKHGIPNFVAYLCTGLFLFGFTQSAVLAGMKSISGNLGLIRALHFPRASLPLAATLTQLQGTFISILVLLGIVIVTGEPITLRWLLVIPALLLQSIFNVGLVLGVARLGAKYPDLRQLAPFVLRTWMYGSGVFYSVGRFTENLPTAAAIAVEMNPMLVFIELMRYTLLSSPPLAADPLQLWLVAGGWASLVLVAGFIYFWRGEREYGRG